jgi:hypothetical protein
MLQWNWIGIGEEWVILDSLAVERLKVCIRLFRTEHG